MKLYLDKRIVDEITLTYLELNLLINSKNTNIYKYIYEFIINSDLLDSKTKNILNLHNIGEYFKAYDNLLMQSDISNSFYDKLSNQMLYIEFLTLIKALKLTSGNNNTENAKNTVNDDRFLSKIEKNKFLNNDNNFNNDYNNQMNSYFGTTDAGNDEIKEAFFRKRHKIIKFFNINLDKIKSFKIEHSDLLYVAEEMRYSYKIILKLFKEFKMIYISKSKSELENEINNQNNYIREKTANNFNNNSSCGISEYKISLSLKFINKQFFYDLKIANEDSSLYENEASYEKDILEKKKNSLANNIQSIKKFVSSNDFIINASASKFKENKNNNFITNNNYNDIDKLIESINDSLEDDKYVKLSKYASESFNIKEETAAAVHEILFENNHANAIESNLGNEAKGKFNPYANVKNKISIEISNQGNLDALNSMGNNNYKNSSNNKNNSNKKLSLMQINSNIKNLGKNNSPSFRGYSSGISFNKQINFQPKNYFSNQRNFEIDESPIKGQTNFTLHSEIKTQGQNSARTNNIIDEESSFKKENLNKNAFRGSASNTSYHRSKADQDFLLKLKVFHSLKKYLIYRRNKNLEKQIISKKESTAKIFYNKLLKSRIFFGFIKNVQNKKYYQIINNNYSEYRKISLKRSLMKMLIYSYNRKKLADNFTCEKKQIFKEKIFKALKSKLKFRITNKKIYFSQLSENKFCVDFIFMVLNASKKLRLPIRKRSKFVYNYNVLKIKKEKNLKLNFFNLLKNLCLHKVEKEKNLVNLAYNFQAKIQKSFIYTCYSALLGIRFKIRVKKVVLNFIKKTFLMRFYFNKYKNEAKKAKVNYLRKKFWSEGLKMIFAKLRLNLKNSLKKKKGFNFANRLKHSKIVSSLNYNENNIINNNNNLIEDKNDSCSVNTTTNKNIKEIITNIQEKTQSKDLIDPKEQFSNLIINQTSENGFDLTYTNLNYKNNENVNCEEYEITKNNNNASNKNNKTHSNSQSLISLSNSLYAANAQNSDNNNKNPLANANAALNHIQTNNLDNFNKGIKADFDDYNVKGQKIELLDLTISNYTEINKTKKKETCNNTNINDKTNLSLIKLKQETAANPENLRLSIITNVFDYIKRTMLIKAKLKLFNLHKLSKNKKNFLSNVRILCIKSLVTQAIIEKHNILKRKMLIVTLIKSSFNKKRLEFFTNKRLVKTKEKIFNEFKNLKANNAKLLISKVKFCLKLLLLKLKVRKERKFSSKKLEAQKSKELFYKLFFLKIQNSKLNKIANKQKYKAETNYFKNSISIKSFLRRLIGKYTLSKKKDFYKKKINFKIFITKSNLLVKNSSISLLLKKVLIVKNFKCFLKNAFDFMEDKYSLNKLNTLNDYYLIKSCLRKIDDAVKNKNLIIQISQFQRLKILTKVLKGIKRNYMNVIKSKMIKQNYEKHLIIGFFKLSVNSLVKAKCFYKDSEKSY